MNRTTIYLPDELKTALARVAAETRQSEAELIREGIRLAIAQHMPPAPRSGYFDGGDPCLSDCADRYHAAVARILAPVQRRIL